MKTPRISTWLSLPAGLLLCQLALAGANDDGTYTDVGTVTIFRESYGCPSGGFGLTAWGYTYPDGGGYTPALTGGQTVLRLNDFNGTPYCLSEQSSSIMISGFTADPTSSWLVSVTCNGITNLASDATSYIYLSPNPPEYPSGRVSWQWTQLFGLPEVLGATASCTIVHY
jgi:hypothetical protein